MRDPADPTPVPPAQDPGHPSLEALLDLPALQALLEDFQVLTQAVVAILDLQGKVRVAVGWQDICTRFHRLHPDTARACTESDLYLVQHLKRGEFVAYPCQNGLWDVVTPLHVGDFHVGNLYTGQFFYDDQEVDRAQFEALAEAHGFDRKAYLEALDRVPRYSRAKVQALMGFLVKLADLIGEQGLRRLQEAQAHASLRASEAQYRSLFEAVRHGLVYQDAQGHILSANPAAERILGLSLDQLQGRTSVDPRWQAIHEDGTPFPGETHPGMVALRTGRPVEAVVMGVFNPAQGETTWIEVSAAPIFQPGNPVPHQVVATFVDITARRRAEEARELSELRLDHAFAASPIGMALVAPEGRFLRVNPTFCAMVGWSEAELLATGFQAITFPEDLAPDLERVQEVLEGTRATYQMDKRYLHREGHVVWAQLNVSLVRDAQGAPLHFVSQIQDISARKVAEARIRKSQAMLTQVLDTIPQSVFWKDRESRYLGCNQAFARAVGLAHPREIVGRTDFDLPWPRAEAEAYRADDREVMEGNRPKHHILEPLQQADGTRLWIDTTKVPLLGEGGLPFGVLGVYQDITERKRNEDELHSAHLRLRALWDIAALSGAPLKVICDSVLETLGRMTQSPFGFHGFLDEDASAMTIHAWSGEAMVGCGILDRPTVFPIAQAGIWAEAVRHRKPLVLNDYATVHPAKRGLPQGHVPLERLLVVPFLVEGRIVSVAAVANRGWDYGPEDVAQITAFLSGVQAIIDRAAMEQSLREREAWYRTILQTAMDGFVVVDEGGWIRQSNEAYARTMGYALEELVGMHLGQLEAQEAPEEMEAHIRMVFERGSHRFVSRHRRKDGTLRDMEVSVQVVPGAEKRMVAFMRDITEARRAEDERERLRLQLHHAQKLESLGSLAGGVAHDLNNVLGAILSLSSTFRTRFTPPDPMAKALDTITSACTRGRDVVRSLLVFARRELEEERAVDLNVLVTETVQLLSHTTLKRVSLVTDLHPGLPSVLGDGAALSHALINLCVNAVDAMPHGGTLTLSTCRAEDGGLVLGVADTGEGMSPEVLEKAMDPFFTTKPLGKGTGLGLSMVYGTLQAHEGRVTLHSRLGEGTEVRLALPPARTVVPEVRVEAPVEPAGRGLRILLVDDDDLIRQAATTMVEVLDHEVVSSPGGREALALLDGGLEVDLVILDMNMPDLSGAQTLPMILARKPSQRVLVASGYLDEAALALQHAHPTVRFIAKPFTLRELQQVLGEVMGEGRARFGL